MRPIAEFRRSITAENAATLQSTNRVLATLPDEVLSSLRPHFERVYLPRGTVIDERLPSVYFVQSGAVSLVTVLEDGTTAEMATVGPEGMVGIGTLLGGEHAPGRYVVRLSGFALTIEASRFRSALHLSPGLRAACDAYAQAFLCHLLQNVACNAAHNVEQRFARSLLMCADAARSDTFELRQEYLAEMLGVRRSIVTVVANTLQRAELIRYRRGAITVRDRRGLEALACECYRIICDAYERLLVPTVGGRRQQSKGDLSVSEQPERDVNLYKTELKRLRSEQGDQTRQERESRRSASAYLDEAIALAHPIALRLLGWLHVSGDQKLDRVFEVFGSSPSTFEGIARLHIIGVLKYGDGNITITSLGERVLNEFGLIDLGESEALGRPASP